MRYYFCKNAVGYEASEYIQNYGPIRTRTFIISPWEERSEAFSLGVHLIFFKFIMVSLLKPGISPLGGKKRSLFSRGSYDFLFFLIGSHCWLRRLLFYFCGAGWVVDGRWDIVGGVELFCHFFYTTNIIYSSCIRISGYKRNLCRTKVLWVLKFVEVGGWGTPVPQTHYIGWFLYFVKNRTFWRDGCSFLCLFSQFFVFFF